ncbi:MAG: hypothetical protein NTY98_04945, partial [Verrucomicrobia bacterium]|nr:hypothetical protein [Verrucomicrobiota bacterium]
AGFVDGPNVYAYVMQNPWSKFDALGLWTWGEVGRDCVETVGGAVSGAYGLVAHGLGAAVETMSGGMLYSGCNEKFNSGVAAEGKATVHMVDEVAHAAMTTAQGRWGETWGHAQNVLGDTPGKMLGNILMIAAPVALNKMKGAKGAPVGEIESSANKGAGRRGSPETRADIDMQRDRILSENPDWVHTHGGTDVVTGAPLPEKYVPGADGGKKGSTYPDLTFQKPDATNHHHNTVDTKADTVTPTTRETNNMERLAKLKPEDTISSTPKPRKVP